MSNAGRPSKLTEELQAEICKYIEQGNTYDRACRLTGISDSIFYLWKAEGEKSESGKYFEFLEAVKKAADLFKAWNIGVIMKAAQENTWQAAAWLLERKYPEEFGRRDRFSITVDDKIGKLMEAFDQE